MRISLGTQAVGSDGNLGTIERFAFNVQSQLVSDLIIKHGLLRDEHIVPLDCMLHSDGTDQVRLDLDHDRLAGHRQFSEAAYTAPSADFSAPPAHQDSGLRSEDYQIEQALAHGAVRGVADKPTGYPGGELRVPTDEHLTVINRGTSIIDVDGQHIGDVQGAIIDSDTGRLVELSLGGGFLQEATVIPGEWVDKVSPHGVLLNVPGRSLEHLKAS